MGVNQEELYDAYTEGEDEEMDARMIERWSSRWNMSAQELEDAQLRRILVDFLKSEMPPAWRFCRARRGFGLLMAVSGSSFREAELFYWNVDTGASTREHPCEALFKGKLQTMRQTRVDEQRRARCDKYYLNPMWVSPTGSTPRSMVAAA